MDENFIALNVTDSQEEAVNVFRKYDQLRYRWSIGGCCWPGDNR